MSPVEGDEVPRQLLEPVLAWSTDRIGVVIGGCAFFSPRMDTVAGAWGAARSQAAEADIRLAWQLQGLLFSASRPSAVALRLDADPRQAPVVELDPAVLGSAAGRVGDLLAGRGLSPPLLAILRARGRIGGLIWLCRDAATGQSQAESARALRHLQPLLEVTQGTAHLDDGARFPDPGDLVDRGLSPQELIVAELAISGAGNAVIAARLGISARTVRNHMTRILAKCGVRSRTQLIALYQPAGEA